MTSPPKARRDALILTLVMCLGLLGLTFADHWLWAHVKVAKPEDLKTKDWWQFLRTLGYWPTWIAAGLIVTLADLRRRQVTGPMRGRPLFTRGLLIILGSGLGGLAAEILKGLTHRYRPGTTGQYMFSWMAGGDYGPGYGLASSHAGVAFGAAFIIARLFPGTGPVVVLLALGCGISRMLYGAHFATDVYVAAMMSYAVAAGLWRLTGPRR
jgi:membrane-associated phospholipid phosphatase